MKRIVLSLLLSMAVLLAYAGSISGTITDTKGTILPYASITVKGTSKGAIANSQGKYVLHLNPGTYTLLCQYVGYKSEEKKVTVGAENSVADFQLAVQELQMAEVVIKRGEDPAVEIIRETIKKRNFRFI